MWWAPIYHVLMRNLRNKKFVHLPNASLKLDENCLNFIQFHFMNCRFFINSCIIPTYLYMQPLGERSRNALDTLLENKIEIVRKIRESPKPARGFKSQKMLDRLIYAIVPSYIKIMQWICVHLWHLWSAVWPKKDAHKFYIHKMIHFKPLIRFSSPRSHS